MFINQGNQIQIKFTFPRYPVDTDVASTSIRRLYNVADVV